MPKFYMAGCLGGLVLLAACARLPAPEGDDARGYTVMLENACFTGVLGDNLSNPQGGGSGWLTLAPRAYPAQSLFRDAHVGLNFEHIFNGTAADREISMFTPRKDTCRIEVHAKNAATLHWPAEHSAWGMACSMTYTLDDCGVEMRFTATPGQARYPLGYAAMMWASYMGRARDRLIHFYGMQEGQEQWLRFGEDLDEGFETGTVRYHGVAPLPYEEGAQTLNILEHPGKTFLLPFYFGLLDGDGDLDTEADSLAYIMMFDQCESIRFALWNFIRDPDRNFDPHSPAWDWQYVIHDPQVGQPYLYRARMEVVPFESREAVRKRYEIWAMGLNSEP